MFGSQEYFQLSVMAVEKISSMSGSCYDKAVSVLRTLAEFRVCVVMLDLELDDLIIHMFKQFLDPNRYIGLLLAKGSIIKHFVFFSNVFPG